MERHSGKASIKHMLVFHLLQCCTHPGKLKDIQEKHQAHVNILPMTINRNCNDQDAMIIGCGVEKSELSIEDIF